MHEQDESGTTPVLLMRSSNASDSGSDNDSLPSLLSRRSEYDSSDDSSTSIESDGNFSVDTS